MSEREPWFPALKLDLANLAQVPTDYGQETHGEACAEALKALVALSKVAETAQAHAEVCCVGQGVTREALESHAKLCAALEAAERLEAHSPRCEEER